MAKEELSTEKPGKVPFAIDIVMQQAGQAVKNYPKAAMFELADDGYSSPFEQLVACIISIRTLDEVSLRLSRQLFARARTPEAMSRLSVTEIDRLIYGSTFHERKAPQIMELSRRLVTEFNGQMPCDEDVILSFSGVGIKCANLMLGIACGQKKISVDIHVHRITNRWGYVQASTPEKTTKELMEVLPEKYWVEINAVLVPFGKHICTGERPHCSTCPILSMCQQIGVTSHR